MSVEGQILLQLAGEIEGQVMGVQTDLQRILKTQSAHTYTLTRVEDASNKSLQYIKDFYRTIIDGIRALLNEIFKGLFGNKSEEMIRLLNLILDIQARHGNVLTQIRGRVDSTKESVRENGGKLDRLLKYFPLPKVDLTGINQKLDRLLNYFPLPKVDLTGINQKLDRLLKYFPIKVVDLSEISKKLDRLLEFFKNFKGIDLTEVKRKLDVIYAYIQEVDNRVIDIQSKVSQLLRYFPLDIDLDSLRNAIFKVSEQVLGLRQLLNAINNTEQLIYKKVIEIAKNFPIRFPSTTVDVDLSSVNKKLDRLLSYVPSNLAYILGLIVKKQDQLLKNFPLRLPDSKLRTKDIVVKVFKLSSQAASGYTTEDRTVKVIEGTEEAEKLEFQRQLELEVALYKKDVVAAVPEWWQIRPEANRPQLICFFREKLPNGKLGAGYWPVTLPHYSGPIRPDVCPIPAHRRGQWEGILTLADNSKLIFHGISSQEVERIITTAKQSINEKLLKGSFIKIGKRSGQPLKEGDMIPWVAKFFSTGAKDMNPDWIAYYSQPS